MGNARKSTFPRCATKPSGIFICSAIRVIILSMEYSDIPIFRYCVVPTFQYSDNPEFFKISVFIIRYSYCRIFVCCVLILFHLHFFRLHFAYGKRPKIDFSPMWTKPSGIFICPIIRVIVLSAKYSDISILYCSDIPIFRQSRIFQNIVSYLFVVEYSIIPYLLPRFNIFLKKIRCKRDKNGLFFRFFGTWQWLALNRYILAFTYISIYWKYMPTFAPYFKR
jgi:hypothetical protein